MIHFNDLVYHRISYEETRSKLNYFCQILNETNHYDIFLKTVKKIIKLQNHIEQMYDYSDIRNMRNSNNSFYQKEINYWNTYKPKFDLLFIPFYQLLLISPYLKRLKK